MDTKRFPESKKLSFQDKVLSQIIQMIEGGKIPWQCPWKKRDERPMNLLTGKLYRGFNAFWLGYLGGSKYWLGMRQANQLGGHIRKGELGTPIIFPRLKKVTEESTEDDQEQDRFALTGFSGSYVWNLKQIDGIEEPRQPQEEEKEFNPIATAEQIFEGMPQRPEIRYGGNSSFYLPKNDLVQLPLIANFKSESEYYSALFHELAHATGHATRLNRKEITEPSRFGSHEYSKEELIAELASSYLCAEAGIERETIQNSAAYIQSWLRALKEDKTMLFFAATQAEKVVDFILNVKEGGVEETEA